jgi:hypothetical protein
LTKSGFSVLRPFGGDDEEDGDLVVVDGEDGGSEHSAGAQDEDEGSSDLRGLPRRSLAVQGAHQHAEIEPGDVVTWQCEDTARQRRQGLAIFFAEEATRNAHSRIRQIGKRRKFVTDLQ